MFVLVSRGDLSPQSDFAELRRYFYNGQSIASDAVQTPNFGQFVIVEAPDARLAEDLRDRLHSGLFGARLFNTKAEAEEEIKHWQEPEDDGMD
jgi:hypothetical protein